MNTQNPNPGNSGSIEATFTFPEISNLIQKKFAERLSDVPMDASPLYIKKSVGYGQGDSIQVNEQDFSTYANAMPEGANAQKGLFGVGYHKQVAWYRYGKEYDITYKARTTAQWIDIVAQTVQAMSTNVPNRMNLDKTHMLTFGAGTNYIDMDGFERDTSTGDGLSLFNSAHFLAFTGATYSNIVTGNPQFSKSALESAEFLSITNIRDNFGAQKRMKFSHIWHADNTTLENDIMQFLKSISDPVQANAGVMNPYRSKYQALRLSLLASDVNGNPDTSKRLWWGIGAFEGSGGERWQAYCVTWEPARLITMPSAGNNGEDRHNDNWSWGVRGTENYATLSGRGIIASMPVI